MTRGNCTATRAIRARSVQGVEHNKELLMRRPDRGTCVHCAGSGGPAARDAFSCAHSADAAGRAAAAFARECARCWGRACELQTRCRAMVLQRCTCCCHRFLSDRKAGNAAAEDSPSTVLAAARKAVSAAEAAAARAASHGACGPPGPAPPLVVTPAPPPLPTPATRPASTVAGGSQASQGELCVPCIRVHGGDHV